MSDKLLQQLHEAIVQQILWNPVAPRNSKHISPSGLSMSKSEQDLRDEKNARDRAHTHSTSSIANLPLEAKYFVIEQQTTRYDSGYGDRGEPDMVTMQYLNLIWFDDEEALEAWVLDATKNNKIYKVVHIEPVKTEVKTVFSIQK